MNTYQPLFNRLVLLVNSLLQHQAHQTRGLAESVQRLISLVALCALAPFLLLVFTAIRSQSKGPAIYTQVRIGVQGKPFKLYKFRSMYTPQDPRYTDPSEIASDRSGVCRKSFNDPRITPIGRILRKLSIDELPQLWNVTKGDMLLIGPRPALECEVAEYDFKARQRLEVKPGLTGLWQISGRADTSFEEQIDLDLRYVREKNFWLDLRILLLTIPAVLSCRGAY